MKNTVRGIYLFIFWSSKDTGEIKSVLFVHKETQGKLETNEVSCLAGDGEAWSEELEEGNSNGEATFQLYMGLTSVTMLSHTF